MQQSRRHSRTGLGLALGGAALAALLASGCKTTDDAVFFALAGEMPGQRSAYIEAEGANRLARPVPSIEIGSFRPAVTPRGTATGATASLRRRYDRLRQILSDRDDEARFRSRSMAINAAQYRQAAADFRLTAGDPLPLYDDEFKERMDRARLTLDNLDADVAKLNTVVRRLEPAARRMRALAGEARVFARSSPEAGTDPGIAALVAAAANTSAAGAEGMVEAARRTMAAFVEYISSQRDTLQRLETQVRTAKGGRQRDVLRRADTLVDMLPARWRRKRTTGATTK